MKPLDIHPTALYEQVQSNIGSFQVLANYRLNSVRTGVWKLQSDQDSKCYYLKTYSRKLAFAAGPGAYTCSFPPT
ncbi:hypothetical protein [Paenibacillus sp. FSL M7-0420]|uniref:hypothetical protein n=1 Tax=Paenibacillus sp. FSL M7-0420 TaxID=2921609 RepID=UPI0030F52B54